MSHSDLIIKVDSFGKWRCSTCQFDNFHPISNCEMCDSPKQKKLKKDLQQTLLHIEPGIQCLDKTCKYFNPLSVDNCKKCSKPLFGDTQNNESTSKRQVSKFQLITCSNCSFQNDPKNAFCLNCERKIKVKKIPKKSVKKTKAVKQMGDYKECFRCGTQLRIINYATQDVEFCMQCENKFPSRFNKKLCLFCDKNILPQQQSVHDSLCKQRIKFYKKQNPTFDRCSSLQYQTMIYLHKKCEQLHYQKQEQLIKKIKDIGYSQKDLENLHHYIMHYAPIIIHINVAKNFKHFISDTHYRNQFQTQKFSGLLSHNERVDWEDRIFDMKHHNTSGFQRVKYGTMNFVNDPKGVRCCASYGQSYFLLKSHVRDRCTITDMDSSSPAATLGTFRFIFHVLMKLTNAQLKSAFQGSKGIQMKSHVIAAYKEIQIHGPIQFSKDIERVYICKDELKFGDPKVLLQQVKDFCSKHSIDYQMFENDPAPRYAPDILSRRKTIVAKLAEQRIIGDQKQLTQKELKKMKSAANYGFYSDFGKVDQ